MDPNTNPNILKHRIDRYKAATIKSDALPKTKEEFDKMMDETIKFFVEAQVRGVWLTIMKEQTELLPIAIKYGFRYHHTKKEYIMLTNWIPKDSVSKLPHYATHFTGVGGVVINDETDEILMIQQRVSLAENMWQIPGGLVDDGEYISQAAVREVLEETGIKTEFQSIIALRDKLDYKWKAADIYFVCLLRPLNYEIKADNEVKNAKWMKIDEFLKLPNMVETQKKIAEVVALRRVKGIEHIKSMSDNLVRDIAGYCGEEFQMQLGNKVVPRNMFYGPAVKNIVKKL